MFDISSVQLDWKGLNLKLETGLMARQETDRSCNIRKNLSFMHSCSIKGLRSNNRLFPLSVHYIEKGYAAGKIPGGFLKERETL